MPKRPSRKRPSGKVLLLRNMSITMGLIAFALIFLVGMDYIYLSNFYLVTMPLMGGSIALFIYAALLHQKEQKQ